MKKTKLAFVDDIVGVHASGQPDRAAVVFEGKRLTYKDIDTAASRIAGNLVRLGIRAKDRVALLLPNCAEFVTCFFAICRMGAVPVPIGTRNRKIEIEQILSHSGARAIVSISSFEGYDFQAALGELQPMLKSLKHVLILGADAPPASPRMSPYEVLEEEIEAGQRRAVAEKLKAARGSRMRDGLALMLYTSGTTGNPKGVMLSHRNILETLTNINATVRARPDDVYLVVVPMTSSLGCVTTMLRAMVAGATLVLVKQFKARPVLEVLQKERVTIEVGVPTMFVLQLMVPEIATYDLSALKMAFMSGSDCLPEVVREVESKMKCTVYIGYGLTESTSYSTITRPEDPTEVRYRTVGRVIPGQEIKLVDGRGKACAQGEVGEVIIKGCGVMMGFFRQARLTHKSIKDGWMATGDLGTMDGKGNLKLLGRKKDLIIRGGFNIYPYEIENFLIAHPSVQNVALVGIQDEVMGERSVACIVLKPDAVAQPGEFIAYCKDALSDYKVPDRVIFFDDLPMTPNGKVKKLELRKRLTGG